MVQVVAPIRLRAELKDLKTIRQFVSEAALRAKVEPTFVYDILLATTEAVTNIIVHGYKNKPGWIEVQVLREDDALWVVLRDEAKHFDPTFFPSPDLSSSLADRQLGGMGIHLIREHMDRLVYRAAPQGGNELMLIKENVFQKVTRES